MCHARPSLTRYLFPRYLSTSTYLVFDSHSAFTVDPNRTDNRQVTGMIVEYPGFPETLRVTLVDPLIASGFMRSSYART